MTGNRDNSFLNRLSWQIGDDQSSIQTHSKTSDPSIFFVFSAVFYLHYKDLAQVVDCKVILPQHHRMNSQNWVPLWAG
jgi:hypothetical protein